MRWVKLAAFLFAWAVFFGLTIGIHFGIWLLRLPDRWRTISRLTKTFASLLTFILKIKIVVEGDRRSVEKGGRFIVSNHMGYLDGIVLGSLFPVIYVSKEEVRRWPIMGQWTALHGTIFIDRKRKDKFPLAVEEMVQKLSDKANILIFPEGTSTNGERLLPFQSAHFAAALRSKATVVPITLSYRRIDGQPVSRANRDKIYWYGDMEFLSHFWNLLALRSIEVSVKIHPAIETSFLRNDSLGRKRLSHACYEIIAGKSKRRREGGLALSFSPTAS